MSEQVGLPASFWAGIWILTAVVLFGSSVWLTFLKPMQDAREEPLPWED
jgi:hypothetical protein